MPNDYTKTAIKAAFIRLLNERPLNKISVKSIVDICNISRNTFYSHYRDKYDIAEQLFEKYKEDFMELLRKSYTNVGKEWAGTDKFDQFSNLPTQTFLHFHQEYGDIMSALNKIKTDKVDMDLFVSQLFKKRYLSAPSNQEDLTPERNLNLEAEIYAAVYNAIARYYADFDPRKPEDAPIHIPYLEESICHAFLFSIGIIEKHYKDSAFQYMMETEKEAKKLKENYQ